MSASVESYAHRVAKQIVIEWLRDAARTAGEDNYTKDTLGVGWRVNRGAPYWGVFEEYPVLADGTGILPCWDEEIESDLPPSYNELAAKGRPPVVIFDVAVQHKGMISCGIEIVHKHSVTPEKYRRVVEICPGLALLVLPAKWVLGQIGMPRAPIPPKFWWAGGRA